MSPSSPALIGVQGPQANPSRPLSPITSSSLRLPPAILHPGAPPDCVILPTRRLSTSDSHPKNMSAITTTSSPPQAVYLPPCSGTSPAFLFLIPISGPNLYCHWRNRRQLISPSASLTPLKLSAWVVHLIRAGGRITTACSSDSTARHRIQSSPGTTSIGGHPL